MQDNAKSVKKDVRLYGLYRTPLVQHFVNDTKRSIHSPKIREYTFLVLTLMSPRRLNDIGVSGSYVGCIRNS